MSGVYLHLCSKNILHYHSIALLTSDVSQELSSPSTQKKRFKKLKSMFETKQILL
jgi:hypothetical protein